MLAPINILNDIGVKLLFILIYFGQLLKLISFMLNGLSHSLQVFWLELLNLLYFKRIRINQILGALGDSWRLGSITLLKLICIRRRKQIPSVFFLEHLSDLIQNLKLDILSQLFVLDKNFSLGIFQPQKVLEICWLIDDIASIRTLTE